LFPKHQYIRSKKVLELVRTLRCQNCKIDDGTVVAAHTNWGGGKGRSIKADDNLIASLCYECHMELDMGYHMTKEERQEMWKVAHIKTIHKLTNLGLWPDKVPIPIY